MTMFEDRLRNALAEVAEEARPGPLLYRLETAARPPRPQRQWVRVAAAAAAAFAVAVGSAVVVSQWDQEDAIVPAEQPPKVFRISDISPTAPGPADLAVVLAGREAVEWNAYKNHLFYVLPRNATAAVRVTPSAAIGPPHAQHLSTDGTRIMRQNNEYTDTELEIVHLATGHTDRLPKDSGFCPQLAPDNRTVALHTAAELRILDVATSRSKWLRYIDMDYAGVDCTGLGWSPDGALLAARHRADSVVLDRDGKVHQTFRGRRAVNGANSWSPDGKRILLYDRAGGKYTVATVKGGAERTLARPDDGVRPLGWAGARIVWLSGSPGAYRLVLTDEQGDETATWMRFDIGDQPIVSVNWSTALTGTPRP